MKGNVTKWGNSLGIRIPASLAALLGIEDGTAVDLNIAEGALIISPKGASLGDLLSRVSPSNLHAETFWGDAEGAEAW